jgi:hypothetical protein
MSNSVGQPQVSTLALLAGAAATVAASAAAAGASALISRCTQHQPLHHTLLYTWSISNACNPPLMKSRGHVHLHICPCRRLPKPRLTSQAWLVLLDDEGRINDQHRLAALCKQVCSCPAVMLLIDSHPHLVTAAWLLFDH